MAAFPRPTAVGARASVLVEDLKRTQIVQYAGASGDYNPLHSDEGFAPRWRATRHLRPRHAHHGDDRPLLTDWVGDETLPSAAASGPRSGRATRSPRPPPSPPSAKQDNETLVALDVETVNQKGEVVVSGTATAALPS